VTLSISMPVTWLLKVNGAVRRLSVWPVKVIGAPTVCNPFAQTRRCVSEGAHAMERSNSVVAGGRPAGPPESARAAGALSDPTAVGATNAPARDNSEIVIRGASPMTIICRVGVEVLLGVGLVQTGRDDVIASAGKQEPRSAARQVHCRRRTRSPLGSAAALGEGGRRPLRLQHLGDAAVETKDVEFASEHGGRIGALVGEERARVRG